MSAFDDKRWIHEDGIYCWTYGHCKIADHEIWKGRDYNNVQVECLINNSYAFI